jgi:hypothetical protein
LGALLSISFQQSLQQACLSFPLLPNNILFYQKILILFSLWFSFIIHASIISSHMLVNSSCMHTFVSSHNFHFLTIIFFLHNIYFFTQLWVSSAKAFFTNMIIFIT